MDLRGRAPWCPACTEGRYEYAAAGAGPTAFLCGRDAVQVRGQGTPLDLARLAARLARVGAVTANEHLVRFHAPEADLVVFRDGRAIVKNVRDTAEARSLYAKYVGA